MGATWRSAMSFQRENFRSLSNRWDEATRYQQIKRYVGRARLVDWVAVDDQPEGWGVDDLDKLVQTNSDTGLPATRQYTLLVVKSQRPSQTARPPTVVQTVSRWKAPYLTVVVGSWVPIADGHPAGITAQKPPLNSPK